MNKKVVIAAFIIAMAMIIYVSGIYGYTPGYKDPPEVPKVEQTVTSTPVPTEIPTLRLEENTNIVVNQPKLSSDCYGGIGGSENNPPRGTTIDDSLTKYYGKPAATGNDETYIYISGWWFNLTQVAKLPSESLMYGMSPCAITSGGSGEPISGDSGNSGDNEDSGDIDQPINPVPELSTMALVLVGLIGLFVIYRKKK